MEMRALGLLKLLTDGASPTYMLRTTKAVTATVVERKTPLVGVRAGGAMAEQPLTVPLKELAFLLKRWGTDGEPAGACFMSRLVQEEDAQLCGYNSIPPSFTRQGHDFWLPFGVFFVSFRLCGLALLGLEAVGWVCNSVSATKPPVG